MQVTIEKMVYGGNGLARTDQGVVFVPKTAPGDVVDMEVIERRKDYANGRLLQIIKASDARQKPTCPNFETVGCCHWDHIQYQRQIEFKKAILVESLSRLAKLPYNDDIETIASLPYGYRLRANFHLHDGTLGFVRENSNTVIPIHECAALSHPLNRFIPLASSLKLAASTVDVVTDGSEIAATFHFDGAERNHPWERWRDALFEIPELVDLTFLTGVQRLEYLKRPLYLELSRHRYRLSPNTFFQANRYLLEPFIEKVVEEVGPSPTDVLDLFSGAGLFSIAIAQSARQVIGVESNKNAVRQARKNATFNKLDNVRFSAGDVGVTLAHANVQPAVVVLNPPRTGTGAKVAAEIAALKAPRIVYVSCNPTTFAADLTVLRKNGYRLEHLTLIDQFPNTYHVELVARLQLD